MEHDLGHNVKDICKETDSDSNTKTDKNVLESNQICDNQCDSNIPKEQIDEDVVMKTNNLLEREVIIEIPRIDLNIIDPDPFVVSTQKLPHSRNNSNLEDQENNTSENELRDFLKPTQKLNLNITESEKMEENVPLCKENMEPLPNISQSDFLDLLGNKIASCIAKIGNHAFEETKAELNLMYFHVEEFKNKSKGSSKNATTQTELTMTDETVQTSSVETCNVSVQTNTCNTRNSSVQTNTCNTSNSSVQTYNEFIERGVQTTLTQNSYSQNSQPLWIDENQQTQIKIANTITQGTLKALESFLKDSDSQLNSSKKVQRNMPSEQFSVPMVIEEKTQNNVFTGSLDNVNFETQDLARQFLYERSKSQKSLKSSGSKSKENVSNSNHNEEVFQQASEVGSFLYKKK